MRNLNEVAYILRESGIIVNLFLFALFFIISFSLFKKYKTIFEKEKEEIGFDLFISCFVGLVSIYIFNFFESTYKILIYVSIISIIIFCISLVLGLIFGKDFKKIISQFKIKGFAPITNFIFLPWCCLDI